MKVKFIPIQRKLKYFYQRWIGRLLFFFLLSMYHYFWFFMCKCLCFYLCFWGDSWWSDSLSPSFFTVTLDPQQYSLIKCLFTTHGSLLLVEFIIAFLIFLSLDIFSIFTLLNTPLFFLLPYIWLVTLFKSNSSTPSFHIDFFLNYLLIFLLRNILTLFV